MKKVFIILSILATSSGVFAQAPSLVWAKCFGGSGIDYGYAVCQTRDGGYIATGQTASTDGDVTGGHGGADVWVTKISATGALQWEKSLGGSGAEAAYSILQTADGGYALAGFTNSNDGDVSGNHGNRDFWMVKLDTAGAIQWQKCLGGSADDICNSMVQTSDGGYILAGSSTSNDSEVSGHKGPSTIFDEPDAWVVKIDDTGAIQWENSYGGSSYDYANSIRQTPEGGYIMACSSGSTDGDITCGCLVGYSGTLLELYYWVVKLSAAGAIEWRKVYGGGNSSEPSCINRTMDGGYIINGYTRAPDSSECLITGSASAGIIVTGHHGLDDNKDLWVIKTDDSGNVQWNRCLGTFGDDVGSTVLQTADSGYAVLGSVDVFSGPSGDVTSSHGGGDDYWLAKLNTRGDIMWNQTFGGSNNEVAYSMAATTDGGYVISGIAQSTDGQVTGNHGSVDYWIVKTSCTADTPTISRRGDTLTAVAFGATYQWMRDGTIIPGATNAVYVATTNGSYTAVATIGDCAGTSQPVVVSGLGVMQYSTTALSVFPNPATSYISVVGGNNITIKIYSTTGQLLKQVSNMNTVSISELVPGFYFVDIITETGEVIKHEKIVKE